MSVQRSAPEGGYNAYGQKRDYRRQVWSVFRRLIGKDELPFADVMLMPSQEGEEIAVASKFGARTEMIHAVDRNAALLATAPWRKEFPRVSVYGNELPRAAQRIAAKGVRLAAANLDMCGCASRPLKECLRDFVASGVLAERSYVAVTVLRGREAPPQTKELEAWSSIARALGVDCRLADSLIGTRELNARDIGRMCAVSAAMFGPNQRAWRPERMAIYKSNRSTMLWWVVETLQLGGPIWKDYHATTDAFYAAGDAQCKRMTDAVVSGLKRAAVADNARDKVAMLKEIVMVRKAMDDHKEWRKRNTAPVSPFSGFLGVPLLTATERSFVNGDCLSDDAIADVLGRPLPESMYAA